MRVDKKKMVEHLTRLYTNGQIKEAVVFGAFASHAITGDQQLMVVVPPLPKVEALPDEIGLLDLDLIIKLIGTLNGEGDVVGIELKDGKLLAEQKHGGKIKMVTGSTTTIATRIGADKIEKFRTFVKEKGVSVPLSQNTVNGVLETAKLLKATQIMIHIGPNGTRIVVGKGNEHSHEGEYEIKDLKAETEYTLPVSSKVLTDVLSQVTDYTQATLTVTGPDSILVVSEADYEYIISPQRLA